MTGVQTCALPISGQVAEAVNQSLDTIAPAAPNPSLTGPAVQEAAQGVLDRVRGRINESAGPLYDALPGQSLDPADYARLQANPSYAAALERFRADPELSAPFASSPDNDLSVLNEVVKQLDTDATAARQTIANPNGNNRLAELRGDARSLAVDLAGGVSDDFSRARQTVETGHRAFLDPLVAGPLGRIADTGDLRSQITSMFPDRAIEGAGVETGDALRLMNEVDPQAAKDLTRQYLATTFGESAQDLSTGPNAWGGAAWRAKIAGNANQRASLNAALEQTGGQDVGDLLDVLAATGRRQHPGTLAALTPSDSKALRGTNALTSALQGGIAPWSAIGNALENANARRNAGALADALMSNPDDALSVMRRAQAVSGNNPLLRAALASYLAQ